MKRNSSVFLMWGWADGDEVMGGGWRGASSHLHETLLQAENVVYTYMRSETIEET